MMPAVSVIIPVYNTAVYLPRCLDSICNQTLKDLEIICVDDASTDGSAAILAEYIAKDPRVKVITFGQNRGVGAARNVGIEAATGEYIGFVDSDDFVDGDFYEKLLEPRRDLVLGNLVEERYDDRGNVVETLNSAWYDKVRHDALKYRVGFFGIFYVALYRRDLIVRNAIRFAESRVVAEDRLFPVLAEYHAGTPIVRDDTFYHYCDRVGSATRRKVNEKIAEGVVGFVGDIADFLRKHVLTASESRFLSSQTLVDALCGSSYQTPYAGTVADAAEAFYREFHSSCDFKSGSVRSALEALRCGHGLDKAVARLWYDAMRANVRRTLPREE